MRRSARHAVLLLFLAVLLSGCAPRLQPPGPEAGTPPALEEAYFRTDDGLRLPLRRWTPDDGEAPEAVVLALHGFNDYADAFADLGPWLAARGVAVLAYDQRGFGAAPHPGLWPGAETLAHDLTTAARLLERRYPGVPVYLLGESMGGAVVMTALAGTDPPPVAGAILSAPAVWGRDAMPFHQRLALAVSAHTLPWLRVTGRGLGIRASDNDEMLRALARDPLVIKETRIDAVYGLVDLMDRAMAAAPHVRQRLLVLYGANDQVIPEQAVLKTLRAFPEVSTRQRVAYYREGWHMLTRDIQAETVWRDIAAWIAAPDAPLPSGADGDGRSWRAPDP